MKTSTAQYIFLLQLLKKTYSRKLYELRSFMIWDVKRRLILDDVVLDSILTININTGINLKNLNCKILNVKCVKCLYKMN